MDLTDIETFEFFFDSLWKPDAPRNEFEKYNFFLITFSYCYVQVIFMYYRVQLNILDTIIFKNGFPIKWLFTSETNGVLFL